MVQALVPLRIRAVPFQPHAFLFGGFDIQMHRTLEVLTAAGMDAKPLDFWDRSEQFDILHIWGLEDMHGTLVRIARQHGKKIVITPLLPYDSPVNRVKHLVRRMQGRRRVLLQMLRDSDRLLVVNDMQAESAVHIFGYPRERIEIVPTMIDPIFFDTRPEPPANELRDYVLCAGNIWPRKNQVRLAQAALAADIPVIFLGNVMGGEEAYAAEFESLIKRSPRLCWHKWVSPQETRGYLYHSRGVALPSFLEQQPTIGLEAAALRKPLLLGKRSYARQSFFRGAYQADPTSVKDIARGLRSLLDSPQEHTPPADLIQQCRPEAVGANLKRIFCSL